MERRVIEWSKLGASNTLVIGLSITKIKLKYVEIVYLKNWTD